ncbi:nuclease-related domain-containing protein [Fredinandcohnia sp. 179-A 10B2 NHS]|uniref:nuclease-related domain-containing protein n=1 Tax=Fredinandcohnia sp. 179-A 10B2 NHS TaxID=3235176 RepID=UPI00399FCD92
MIQKDLEIPYRVLQLEAYLKRITESHPRYSDIRDEHSRRFAGYRGEQSLVYYLSLLPQKDYHIFHNLRLLDTSNKHFFEIDTLILTPSFTLIIDAKNYRGKLYFDDQFEQLIQTYVDTEKAYPCPIAQANRHELQLKRLLQANKFHLPSIESLVIFTNPSCIISASPRHKQIHKVIRSTSFLSKIETFEKKHKNVIFDQKQLQKLAKFLLKKHTPHAENILEQYENGYDYLRKGVGCPDCGALPMVRTERRWLCKSCGCSSKTAHLEAIRDYYLLVGKTITNQQLREFLLLPSRVAAKNILLSLRLDHNGGQKNRIYYLTCEKSQL